MADDRKERDAQPEEAEAPPNRDEPGPDELLASYLWEDGGPNETDAGSEPGEDAEQEAATSRDPGADPETADDPRDEAEQEAAGDSPGEPGPEEPGAGEPQGPPLDDLIAEIDRQVAAHPGQEAGTAVAGEEPAKGETRRHLLFSLAGTRCAVPLEHLMELGGLPRITPVPNLPGWVHGVTNLRGDILSVLDLAAFFDMEPPAGRKVTRLLVVRDLGEEAAAGLLADEVHGIVDLPVGAMRPPAAPIENRLAPFLTGVAEHGERLVSVLDLEKLFAAPEFRLEAG